MTMSDHAALWSAVDAYISHHVVPLDEPLSAALADSSAANLPAINVAPNQGKLLHILARVMGAQRILEIGTLGGFSTIWLARAVPAGGRVVTLEAVPRHAEVAGANIARAGLDQVVDIVVGPALQSLRELRSRYREPFDLTFIDADKANIPDYFSWAVKLSRPGSLIVVDNVVRNGRIVDGEGDTDADTAGVRRLFAALSRDTRVTVTALQTVGTKGHDGVLLAIVNE